MTGRTKAPVEPLSRAAWDRVEARLFERLDRGEHLLPTRPVVEAARHRAGLWVGLGVTAAAAALALWWRFDAPAPLASEEQPSPAPLELTATAAPALREAAHIVTTSAPTRTTIGEAALTLAARSEVHVAGSDAEGWLVHLDHGEVECEVAPRRGRPPFVVQAGETRVTVVGTRFSVTREGPAARVSVREGRVQVASGPHQLSLGPGEQWPDVPAAAPADAPGVDVPALEPPQHRAKPRQHAKRRAADAGEQFEKAARLEATDADSAIAIYRRLVASRGPWAANALYAQARLEHERGRTERARRLLAGYLRRYPSGANAADVRTLLERLDRGGAPR